MPVVLLLIDFSLFVKNEIDFLKKEAWPLKTKETYDFQVNLYS